MPKIIKDLEKKIIESALRLFEDSSYKNVSMRKISKEAGIAVGTLYNYFPTKKELYLAVYEKSWDNTYNKLKEKTDEIDENFIYKFFKILYKEMQNKRCLVRELFHYIAGDMEMNQEKREKTFARIKFPDIIVDEIYDLFLVNIKKEYNVDIKDKDPQLNRLFTMLQTFIPLLYNIYKEEDEINLSFIDSVVDSYVKNNILD